MILVLALAACSERAPAPPASDAGHDAAPDASPDAAPDASSDAGGPLYEWTVTTVDDDGRTDPSIAIGADGVAHVAYYAFPSDLRYATDASGAWVPEIVDDFPDTGGWSSLALADDEIRISYHDYDQGRLVLARGRAGAWATETVDTGPRGNGRFTSQGLDGAGASHVGFSRGDLAGSDLAYATDASGAWVVETVEADGRSGEQASLRIAPDGVVHLVAIRRDVDGGQVRHATKDGAGWTIETVPLPEGATDAALAIDGARLHLAWTGADDGALHHAWNDGVWSDELVDGGGNARGVALAIDASGALHVAYPRGEVCPGEVCDRGDVFYATNRAGDWRTELVEHQGTTALGLGISIDPDGLPAIVFADQATPAVRIARARRAQ